MVTGVIIKVFHVEQREPVRNLFSAPGGIWANEDAGYVSNKPMSGIYRIKGV